MAQETFTDVQPIQQAKPEQFTDVQPIPKPAPSTPISSEEKQRYALTHPEAGNLPGVQKPSPEMHKTPLFVPEGHLTDEERMTFKAKPAPWLGEFDPVKDFKQGSQIMSAAGSQAGRKVGANVIPTADLLASDLGSKQKPLTEEESRQQFPVATGVLEGAGGMAGGMAADPTNWALLATGAEVGPILSKVASAAFTANMGKDVVEGAKQLGADWDKLTPEQRSERITQLGLTDIFAGTAGAHVATGEGGAIDLAGKANESIVKPAIRKTSGAIADASKVAIPALGAGIGSAIASEAGIPHPYMIGGAAGAAAGRVVAPKVAGFFDRGKTFGMGPEESAYTRLEERAQKSGKELAAAQQEIDDYKASHDKTLSAPDDVQKKYEKVKAKAEEDRLHAELAKEALEKSRRPQPAEAAPQPDQPIESITPKREAPIETVKPARAINVKGPGEIQPETFPQEPTQKPTVNEGATVPLARSEGMRIGKPKLLADVNPEPEVPKQEVIPPPEKPVKVGKPDRGNIRSLTVDEKGNVVDKEATPEGHLESLIRKGLEPEKKSPLGKINTEVPEVTAEKPKAENRVAERRQEEVPVEEERRVGPRRNAAGIRVDDQGNPELSPDLQGHWQSSVFGEKPVEDIGSKAREKNPEPTREETKGARKPVEVPKRSAEATDVEPKVHEQVANLSDENLKKLAKAHGLDPESYDFKARDEGRHRVDRDQLAKDITAKMGDDEVQNIAHNAQKLDNPATAGFAKAERAEKVFPRLRGEVDEFGNPKQSGGSQAADDEAEALKEHVGQTSAKDTDHVQAALKELGPNANLSDVMKRAQELKDNAKTPEGLTEVRKGESTNSKGDKLTHEVKEGQHHVETRDANGKKIGETVAKDIGNGTVEVVSNQIYDKNLRGEGRGTEQMKHLLRNVGDETKTVKSDISTSDPARKSWDKLEKQFPEAVHKTEYKDGQTQYTVDMKKYREPIDVSKGASDYNAQEKLPKIEPEKVEKDARSAELADDYQKMKHEPNDPHVKKSYDALVDDVKKQWDYATKKLGIQIVPTDVDPYKSYEEMKDDVEKNKQMKVWRGGNPLPEDHPLAKVDPKTGENYNTMFRAVHDIFGHVAQDHDFSEPGEESAWNVHRQMMNHDAVPAMTTETRGQTSWFFNNEGVRGGEPLGKFADQKAGLLPEYANERTPEAGKTLDHIKSGKDFSVLTAENPNNTRISDAENAARNRKLVSELREKGYKPVPVEGNTKDVEGQKEHSFFVPDISPKDAAEFGRAHGQAAILTNQGLHDLKTDKINPSDNAKVMTGEEARKQPYYSRVGDQDFSVPIDFSKEQPFGKAEGPKASMDTARMSDADLEKAGFTKEQIRNGEHLPTASGGSQAAGAAPAKVGKLPKLAEENLLPEEKAGVTKSQAGRDAFVDRLMNMPSVKETTDIAKAGEGGKNWYQRSTKAFDHLMDEAPRYFKPEDRKPFLDFLAAGSPQQSVAMNLREALHTWTQYVDEGRPTGKELEKLLKDNFTLPGAKVPNAMKALSGQPLWPDLSKNMTFKVPSFGDNLSGKLDRVTNDGWMALFNGLDAKQMPKANAYHAVSAVTRAAADALGWKPAEAQAAIWAFTKIFTEKGETDPSIIRKYSEDFADIMRHDPESRQLIQKLGVDLGKLDTKLEGIGPKPQVTSGASPTTENSVRKLASRIETARGKGTIPPPKSGYLGFDEDTEFNPEEFETVKPKKKR